MENEPNIRTLEQVARMIIGQYEFGNPLRNMNEEDIVSFLRNGTVIAELNEKGDRLIREDIYTHRQSDFYIPGKVSRGWYKLLHLYDNDSREGNYRIIGTVKVHDESLELRENNSIHVFKSEIHVERIRSIFHPVIKFNDVGFNCYSSYLGITGCFVSLPRDAKIIDYRRNK